MVSVVAWLDRKDVVRTIAGGSTLVTNAINTNTKKPSSKHSRQRLAVSVRDGCILSRSVIQCCLRGHTQGVSPLDCR